MISIAVLGSANADLYVEVPRAPKEGETLPAGGGEVRPGGKGANQAAAAALLGVKTYFLGQIGQDGAGEMLQKELGKRKVNLDYLSVIPNISSGQAIVMLMPSGENSIILIGGANAQWQGISPLIESGLLQASALLMQREIPDDINLQAARLCRQNNKLVVMDAGGKLGSIPEEMLEIIDILSPNSVEIEEITGVKGDPEAAARVLLSKGVKHVVVKLSEEGSLYVGSQGVYRQKAVVIENMGIVDTTGAGDCFTAALVARLLERGANCLLEDFQDAMQFASAAAFLSITKKGAMESMPERGIVDSLIESILGK